MMSLNCGKVDKIHGSEVAEADSRMEDYAGFVAAIHIHQANMA